MKDENKRVLLILEDIINFCQKIKKYIKDLDKKSFKENELVIDGVLRNLETFGEASRRLSEEFKKEHNEIPWKKIIGLRNILIHEYGDVDLDIIWDIITINIPDTFKSIKLIFDEYIELDNKN